MSCWFSCAPKNRVGIPIVSETRVLARLSELYSFKMYYFLKNLVSLSYSVLSGLFD